MSTLINFKLARKPMLKPRNRLWGWLGKGGRVKAVVMAAGKLGYFSGDIDKFNQLSVTGIYFIKKPWGYYVEQ